ncbi:MAG: OmpA family protein [Pseudomonadota bacterium]
MSERLKLLLAPGSTLIVAAFAVLAFSLAKGIERAELRAATTAVQSADASWLDISANGRTLYLTGDAPDAPARASIVNAIRTAVGSGVAIEAGDVTTSTVPALTGDGETIRAIEPLTTLAKQQDQNAVSIPTQTLTLQDQAPSTLELKPDQKPEEQIEKRGDNQSIDDRNARAAQCRMALDATPDKRQIIFLADSTRLSPLEVDFLERTARVLRSCGRVAVRISGNTDSSGAAASNQALSLERAQIVKAVLDRAGVGTAELTAEGRGAADPIASNRTEAGRALNRRIDITIDAAP